MKRYSEFSIAIWIFAGRQILSTKLSRSGDNNSNLYRCAWHAKSAKFNMFRGRGRRFLTSGFTYIIIIAIFLLIYEKTVENAQGI